MGLLNISCSFCFDWLGFAWPCLSTKILFLIRIECIAVKLLILVQSQKKETKHKASLWRRQRVEKKIQFEMQIDGRF